MIRSVLLSGVAAVALATGAMAADLPSIKGPPVYAPPPLPVFTWTGFYIGINGGYGGDKFTWNDSDPYDDYYNYNESMTSSGFLGGGTVGFNYQFPGSNFVAGVEGDFDGSSIKAQDSYSESYGDGYSESDTYGSKLNWLATVRGRLGYAISTGFGNILPYVTGGVAFGHVTTFDNYSEGYYSEGYYSDSYSIGHTYTGWAAGAGLEYAITQNLTFKTEYLYVNLGTHNVDLSGTYSYDPYETATIKSTFNIVRAGLNWKFDFFAPPAPVVAKY